MAAPAARVPRSVRWGYIRIITGTILGGVLGFYVMHRVETAYKEKMRERLAKYEQEMMSKRKREGDGGEPQLFSSSID